MRIQPSIMHVYNYFKYFRTNMPHLRTSRAMTSRCTITYSMVYSQFLQNTDNTILLC